MTNTPSYNETTGEKVQDFLIPSGLAITFYIIVAVLIQAVFNATLLWRLLTGVNVTAQDTTLLINWLNNASRWLATPLVWLFWLFVGTVAYMIVWFTQNIASRIHEDVEEAHYVATPLKRDYLRSAFAHYLSLGCLAVIFGSYVVFVIKFALPKLVYLFSSSLESPSQINNIGRILLAIAGTALLLYVFELLWRVLVYVWQTVRTME